MRKNYFKPIIPAGIACFALLMLAGCATSGVSPKSGLDWERHGPFALRLPPKTVKWTKGYPKGFDPAIQGYHFTGDIASLRLRPAGEKAPEKIVLAITTPSGKPHLDHFRISVRGAHIDAEPFKPSIPTRVSSSNREQNSFKLVDRGTYFDFKVQGTEVYVIFKPALIDLLAGETIVSWIDRYRN